MTPIRRNDPENPPWIRPEAELLISLDPWVFSWSEGAADILMIEAVVDGPEIEGTVLTGRLVAKITAPENLDFARSLPFEAFCRGVVWGLAQAEIVVEEGS